VLQCSAEWLALRIKHQQQRQLYRAWLRKLKEDKRLAVHAATAAQKAADFILGKPFVV
jgi:antirestriction protein ArdC